MVLIKKGTQESLKNKGDITVRCVESKKQHADILTKLISRDIQGAPHVLAPARVGYEKLWDMSPLEMVVIVG